MDPLWVYLVLLPFLMACPQQIHSYEVARGRHVINAMSANSHLSQIAKSDVPELYLETLRGLAKGARPCQRKPVERFSRPDGLCNNLKNPFQGSVLSTERRLFSNTYLDGRGFPRTKGADFSDLPSAREVSRRCFGSGEDADAKPNGINTQLVWQFGQLVAHDISLVDPFHGLTTCCDEFVEGLDHPDLHRNGTCFPISISWNDPAFNTSCMPFVRSVAVDVQGAREQVNAVTSYIDASTIYGSTISQTHDLRLWSQGLLATTRETLLPSKMTSLTPPCRRNLLTSSPTCPFGGDVRVHVQSGLNAIHTLFHLEHNRIARRLFSNNRYWDDERIFQETRKIMIAIMQSITYEEFLPAVLGPDVMDLFNLRGVNKYNDDVDATAQLEFSTAAFRFGHSLVNTVVRNFSLHEGFMRAIEDENDIPSILFYQARNDALKFDNLFTSEIRELLFVNVSLPDVAPEGVKFDLMARNIQRGRDHGIAPYTIVRDACRTLLSGLPGVEQDTPTCMEEGVYRHDDDVDLFVGGMSEMAMPNATVGPTFACLIGVQFETLKRGDRFFYESDGGTEEPSPFSEEQREFIRRNTLAALLCEVAPEESLQRNAFLPVSESNPLVPCRTILEERNLDEGLLVFDNSNQDESISKPLFDALNKRH